MSKPKNDEVMVVGNGIVGLISAYFLSEAGFRVEVIDAGPDPRAQNYDLDKSGTTYRGGNARHISATETCPHATSSRAGLIFKPTRLGGWLAKDSETLTSEEKKWMEDFEYFTSKTKIIDEYTNDICRVNNLGKKLWKQLISQKPFLFQNVELKRNATIFFLNNERFKGEADFEDLYNPTVTRLYKKELIRKYPDISQIFEKNILVGAIEEDCPAVLAIDLCRNIILYLRQNGVTFRWDEKVTEMKMRDNSVEYLISDKAEKLQADNYVFSTGYFSQDLYKNTRLAGKVMGVAGVWVNIPNPGIKDTFKIDAPEPTGYINATVTGERLWISGGYGFVGHDKLDLQCPGVKALFDHFESIIEKIFPESYHQAIRDGSINRRACVRPMTACDLGVFEVLPTHNGGKAIIIGANSAGGLTQAPAVAEAVIHALTDQDNPIFELFNPSRFETNSKHNVQR